MCVFSAPLFFLCKLSQSVNQSLFQAKIQWNTKKREREEEKEKKEKEGKNKHAVQCLHKNGHYVCGILCRETDYAAE